MDGTLAEPVVSVRPKTYNAWYIGYIVFVLWAVQACNQIDRQLLSILLEPIKKDLHATDTQMGLLSGVYFMAFYLLASIPIARLADTRSRRGVIAACVGVWTIATAMCGVVQSYAQFAVTRTFVAVGEGGSQPASHALLSSIVPLRLRARVFGVIACGSAAGIGFGLFLGGALHHAMGWRQAMVVISLPGLLLVPLLLFTIPEPDRDQPTAAAPRRSTFQVLAYLATIPTFRWVALYACAGGFVGFTALGWMPTFLIRVHGRSIEQVGLYLGIAQGLGMLLGNLSVGVLADWFGRRNPQWFIWMGGVGLGLCFPFGWLSAFAPTAQLALIAYFVFAYFLSWFPSCLQTTTMAVVEPKSRAIASATALVFQSIGGALGPLFIGRSNDLLQPHFGALAIRYSIAAAFLVGLVGAGAAYVAGRKLPKDFKTTPIDQAVIG